MADYTDTKVSQLVINNLTQEKFEELKAKGELQDDQIYCTPDTLAEQLANKADADLNNTQALKKTGGELLGTLNLKPTILASSIDETEIMLLSGSSAANGALFVVYGKNGDSAGQFLARACSADGTMYDLRGAPDGTLMWGGKHVLREQAAYALGVSGYIKLNNGMTLAWGVSSAAEIHTVSLPIAFTGDSYVVCVTPLDPNGPFYAPAIYEKTGTYFKIRAAANAALVPLLWFAIGY